MQGDSRNSDTIALTGSDRSQIFSTPDSDENFIRSYFSKNYHHRYRNEAEAKNDVRIERIDTRQQILHFADMDHAG
jgi:hypothetical protein